MKIDEIIVLAIVMGIIGYGFVSNVDVFDAFVRGAKEGILVVFKILPSICAMLLAIGMITASGALEALTGIIAPYAAYIMVPPDIIPLALIRPISGSGGLAVTKLLFEKISPDSYVGRIASVLSGASETTFYTIAIYYGAAGIKNTRHTIAAALVADLFALIGSIVAVSLLFGRG